MCIVEGELNIDGGKHVLALFLNQELLWMNNKTIIEFGFRIIWRIMEISEGVIRRGLTQPHSLIVKYTTITGEKNKTGQMYGLT